MRKTDTLLPYVTVLLSGCFYVQPAWTPPPFVFDCPTQDCSAHVEIPMEDFKDCFSDGNGGWVFPPFLIELSTGEEQIDMQKCIDQYHNGDDSCVLTESLTPDAPPPCCALEADIISGAVDCCPEQTISEAEDSLYLYWLNFFGEFCPQADLSFAEDCDNSAPPVMTGIECDEPTSQGLGADVQLIANPILSTIAIKGPGVNYSSSVAAFGAASSSPAEFLRAYGVADDATTSAGLLKDVHFIHTSDASMVVSGSNYWVPNSQLGGIVVQGKLNGVQKSWGLSSSGSVASGQIMKTAGTWYMDYAGSNGGYSVALHLEGNATCL